MELISFIIPVYNEQKTLQQAIEQIVNLNYREKEILIIDNNSTDGSKDIIKKFSNLKNVKILFKDKNLGYGDSIKKGLNMANGEFIYIQYADLEYDIKGLELMFEKLNSNNYDFVFGERYSNLSIINLLKNIIKRPAYLATYITTHLVNFFYKKKFNDIIGSKLYRTDKIREIKIDCDGQGFDFELVSKICKFDYKVGNILIPYKPRANSNEKKIKFYHMFNAIYEILRVKII